MSLITGTEMYDLANRLFPVCRSITGNGVRETLAALKEIYPQLNIYEVPSGTRVFDWTVPKEWNIKEAYIENSRGERIIDFKENNLHVVGYSIPVDTYMSLEELRQYIYTEPSQPEYIPYVTSYYKESFGFCMSENQLRGLEEDTYHVVIDSELKNGSLTYGEILIPGKSKKEIFLSTYICHPSMANNELSGPCVAIYLAKSILEMNERKVSYRIVLVPETIGSITYLHFNLDQMKGNIIAGYNISCVGDNRTYSYIETKYADTLTDKAAKNILSFYYPEYKNYSFLKRGSDERQYGAPGVELPVGSICRSKYAEYPEYHTSADNMELISPEGLRGAYEVYMRCIRLLDKNAYYKMNCLCEPQLGKRGLYPTISKKGSCDDIDNMMNFMTYADGRNDLIDISNIIGTPAEVVIQIAEKLEKYGLISKIQPEEGI